MSLAPASDGGFLLLRRGGGLYGVASGEVTGLGRRGTEFRVEIVGLDDGGLFADEVVGVVSGLEVRPLAPLLGRYWSEPAGGWAVHEGVPVIVVDPAHPPRALQGDGQDGE